VSSFFGKHFVSPPSAPRHHRVETIAVCTLGCASVTVRVRGFLEEEFGSDTASIMAGGEVEKKKPIISGELDEGDLKMIADLEDKFELNKTDLDAEGKYKAIVLMFGEAVSENLKFKAEVRNLVEQMGKQTETLTALQKLVTALKSQITLTKEEGDLKLKEETHKRMESAKSFENTMVELTTLMETHVDHNSRLREENNKMASQMTILLAQYEEQEGGSNAKTQERILELKLYEAKLAKAQIEKAEMNADFTRERLEFHKMLIDAHAQRDSAQQQFYDLEETVKLYQEQYAELEKNMKDGGATKKENFEMFRKEMDKLGKKLRVVERECTDWKEKFDGSNDQVKKMNTLSLEREKEFQGVKKKLAAMEKLNRALQEERAKLIKSTKNGDGEATNGAD